MARPKAKAAPRFVEAEDERQDPEDRQRLEAEEPETSGRRMSKTDAIREAMAEGIESPGDGVDFIRKRFGLEMSKGHFSATKSKLKSSEGQGGKKTAPAKAAPAKAAAKSGPEPVAERQRATSRPASGEGNLLDLMEQMKPMVDEHGVDTLKRIVDLLG
jgi:hypothetical protein